MRYLGLAIALIFGAGVVWLVWNNRASEKVVSAVLPIAIGAGAALLLVMAFAGESPVSHTFPAMFFYRDSDAMPARAPYRGVGQHLYLLGQLWKLDPTVFDPGPNRRELLYHHLLQRGIADTLTLKFRNSWQMDFVPLNLQGARAEFFEPIANAQPSTIITAQTLEQKFRDNVFAKLPWTSQLALPPDTTMSVITPKLHSEAGEIRFSGPLCTLVIRTNFALSQRGIGQYASLEGGDPLDETQWRAAYIVRTTATFSRWRSGHPDLPSRRAWAEQVVEQMRSEFDEDRTWQDVRDRFLLQRQFPPLRDTSRGAVPPEAK